jgi:hypothetical protein
MASSSRGDTEASQRVAAWADRNASQRIGAATSTGLVPGRRCTFRACTSTRSNRYSPQSTSRARMRSWPYWPTARARSEPSTDRSSRTMVRSWPAKANVRRLPISQFRAVSTITVNGSPTSRPGWGRPSEAAAADVKDRTSARLRFHSSNGQRSAMIPGYPGSRSWPAW